MPAVGNVVNLSTLPSNAVCCAVDTGLSASDVLSALPNPTCALVTSWGLDVLEIWLSILPSTSLILPFNAFTSLSIREFIISLSA